MSKTQGYSAPEIHLILRLDSFLLDPFVAIDTIETEGHTQDDHAVSEAGPSTRPSSWINHPHPPPKAFDLLRKEVEERLCESTKGFIRACFRTTGYVKSVM
jgi:hypothetical protein